MLGSILISLLILAGPGPAFRSDRLETMADALGRARVEALPDGESLLSWSGATVSVVKCGGTVEHIGYALFSGEQRELIGPTVGHFVERYSLEADLPLQREKTLEVQLMEDGVSFPKGGGLDSLLPLSLEPGLSLKLSELGGRWYLLEWGSFSMMFPSDAELLLGRTRQEDERRLPGELASAPDPVAPPLPSAGELSERTDHILEQALGCYYLPSLNADRYFTASVEPVDAPEYPSETFANILAGLVDAGSITVQVRRSVYGLQWDYFTIPLRALIGYSQQFGCTPYWGVIARDGELMEGELILRNAAAGFNHVLRLQVPYEVLALKEGSILARLTPYVPTHSLKYLFEETRQ